jgi:shikimate dehydrogenase
MPDQYAVIGNPIEHSKSPQIHAAFARQTGQDLEYGRILGSRDDFAGDVRRFVAGGGRGLNVTVPFKEAAFELADALSERAQRAEAVNTLSFDAGQIHGDNTDGAGLVRDLGCNQRFDFGGSRILLLGAGGASRGVLIPLLDENPALVVIANRTAHKAHELAALADSDRVSGCGLDELAGEHFDLIINATAAGLSGEVPVIPDDCLAAGGWTYDMMYASEPTAFVRWGREHGAVRALDGLGMLVEQAAESFFIWRSVMPDTEAVIDALRAGREP